MDEQAAPRKRTPAKKAVPPVKKAVPPAKAPVQPGVPGQNVTKATPAKAAQAPGEVTKATPRKRATRAVKAAAAEVAPALVQPPLLEDPQPTPAPAEIKAPAPAEAKTEAPAETKAPESEAPKATAPAVKAPAQKPEDQAPEKRTEAWARLIADPGHSPELLALAATQSLGPAAAEWARGIRNLYPTATPDAVARLAVRQFTRFGTASSVFAAVAGSYAPVALLGAAALAHAELSLHVAAAYGLDPTEEARAVDLLVLSGVHPSREDAVAALEAAQEYTYEATGLTDAAWRLGRMLAAQAGGWAVLRLVNRAFPGTSLLAALLTSRAAVRTSGARAGFYFRSQSSQPEGSSV